LKSRGGKILSSYDCCEQSSTETEKTKSFSNENTAQRFMNTFIQFFVVAIVQTVHEAPQTSRALLSHFGRVNCKLLNPRGGFKVQATEQQENLADYICAAA
jgi:hypothetical protein